MYRRSRNMRCRYSMAKNVFEDLSIVFLHFFPYFHKDSYFLLFFKNTPLVFPSFILYLFCQCTSFSFFKFFHSFSIMNISHFIGNFFSLNSLSFLENEQKERIYHKFRIELVEKGKTYFFITFLLFFYPI